MKLKHLFILTLLIASYGYGWTLGLDSDYEEDSESPVSRPPSLGELLSSPEEQPAAPHQPWEQTLNAATDIMPADKRLHNISNNNLSQDISSMEEHTSIQQMDEGESTERMAIPNNQEDAAVDMLAESNEANGKQARTGRLLPPITTTIPDYIHHAMTNSGEEDIQQRSQEALNLSRSDYMAEEEAAPDQQALRKEPETERPNLYDGLKRHNLQAEEHTVPLAVKYYDVDDEVEGDHQHHYQQDDDDYNTNPSAMADDGNNNQLHSHHTNDPVPMPRQQLPQQNSSEEYYDEENAYSKDQESSTMNNLPSSTTTASVQAADNNIMRAIFPGFPLFNPTTSAPTTTTTTMATTATMNSLVTPITQYDGVALAMTTSAPVYRQHHVMQTFSGAGPAIPPAAAIGDKKGKQIPIVPTTTTTISSTAAATTVPTSPTATTSSSAPTTTITATAAVPSSRRRLLPHEQLRNYIEDAYIRMPLAVIVDPSSESLEKTKALWNDALHSNLNIKIVLVTLNESDIPAAFNFNNTRQFLTGLNSIKEHEGGDAFRGISHAAELVPYDSAVFISTAMLANHTDQVHDAAITLLKKRIRLYLIWFGERSLSENETQETVGGILGEVAIRSGGEVLHLVGSESSQELEGSTLTIVADAFRGSQEVDVPVDTTLSSLHVKIDQLMRRAVLETPNGG